MTTDPLSLTQRRVPDKQMPTGLSRFQHMLLVTDGTVTEMLEQYLEEKIRVNKLYEKIEEDWLRVFPHHQAWLDRDSLPVMRREILLQGQHSLRNWLHAESTIILNHLPAGFRADLLHSREPIGRLWEKYQLETFKKILDFARHEAAALAGYFGVSARDRVISRTYSVYSGGGMIMLITETFPALFFNA